MSHVTGSGGIRWGGKGVTCNGVWWDSRGRKVSHVTGSGGIRGGGKGFLSSKDKLKRSERQAEDKLKTS